MQNKELKTTAKEVTREYHRKTRFCFLVQIRAFVIQNTLGLQKSNMKENTKLILV